QLRANINNSYTAYNIIEQSYILDIHNNQLFNMFRTEKVYPYKQNQLDYLTKKSSLFLLEHFQKIFQNIGKSKINPTIPNKDREKNKFFMPTLDEILELKCLPTGYHIAHLPSFNICDHCNIPIKFSTGKTYICGHSFHDDCYNKYNA
ncbi:1215_t:CDS:1, partial [Gigaspora rosea]